MVEKQLVKRGIRDARVLQAMREIPRHLFLPDEIRPHAYEDRAIGIGYAQTISQPYMVALMLQALALRGPEKVLEIGTGSGYQAALLGRLALNEAISLRRWAGIVLVMAGVALVSAGSAVSTVKRAGAPR